MDLFADSRVLRSNFVSDVLEAPVLVLDRNYQPLRLAPVRYAFSLLARGAAQAIARSGHCYDFDRWLLLPVLPQDGSVCTVQHRIRVPRVLRLVCHGRTNGFRLPLSHRNVMLRDGFQCQYCGGRPGLTGLNIDHVTPKSRGGSNTWDNLVTACRACNVQKGRRTPEECGMSLLRPPKRPQSSRAIEILFGPRPRCEEWEPYLQAG